MLVCQRVHWTRSACWVAGGNALSGTVPSSWASMAALQDLELDYNCGLCGSLPSFPMQVLAVSIVSMSLFSHVTDLKCLNVTTLRDSQYVGTCLGTLLPKAQSAVLQI